MKTPQITPEQRAALERAKNGRSLYRAYHGKGALQSRFHREEKVVPAHARLVRK